MIYVFVFLGEFGFELFNWQGVVRKFAGTLQNGERIICCSRANLYPIYESADLYIDISEVQSFRKGRAVGYWTVPYSLGPATSIQAWFYDRLLKTQIKSYVLEQLKSTTDILEDVCFIFSSDQAVLNGLTFGHIRSGPIRLLLGTLYCGLVNFFLEQRPQIDHLKSFLFNIFSHMDHSADGDIYERLNLSNNSYRQIEPDFSVLEQVEAQLGWSLTEPFILCQSRQRQGHRASADLLDADAIAALVAELSQHIKVVFLSFRTGRWLDSYSDFDELPQYHRYQCKSFPEQSCLIYFSRHCLFFTEGDFGSHIYLPPFLGKDVTAVATRSVYALESAPIKFWNENIFIYGGQVMPAVSETYLPSIESASAFSRDILRRAGVIIGDEVAEYNKGIS